MLRCDPVEIADVVIAAVDDALREGVQPEVVAKPSPDDPRDITTSVDLAIEERLQEVLRRRVPEAEFVGEETVGRHPERLRLLEEKDYVFLLDPLDGTKNFVAGRKSFGTMLALIARGETIQSWIYLPRQNALYVAERGSGAFRTHAVAPDGRGSVATLHCDAFHRHAPAEGTIHVTYMPEAERDALLARATAHTRLVPSSGSAAVEYADLVEARKDYLVYRRLHTWDHAPGVLLLEEAGGVARYADGQNYRPNGRPGPLYCVRCSEDIQPLLRLLGS